MPAGLIGDLQVGQGQDAITGVADSHQLTVLRLFGNVIVHLRGGVKLLFEPSSGTYLALHNHRSRAIGSLGADLDAGNLVIFRHLEEDGLTLCQIDLVVGTVVGILSNRSFFSAVDEHIPSPPFCNRKFDNSAKNYRPGYGHSAECGHTPPGPGICCYKL